MPKLLQLVGHRFGSLTVRKRVGSARNKIWWDCYCDCGKSTFVDTGNLTSSNVRSCGCGQRAAAARSCVSRSKHFMRGTRLYAIWRSMRQRCYNKNQIGYKHYGGRGIRVCAEWRRDFVPFMEWAISNGYAAHLSVDRKDVNGNYEPGNCRWITAKEQAFNRRNSRVLTLNGETMNLVDWSVKTGIGVTTLAYRMQRKLPAKLILGIKPYKGNKLDAAT